MTSMLYFASQAYGGMISAVGFIAESTEDALPDINALILGAVATYRGILIGSRAQFKDMNAHIEAVGISE